MTRDRRAPSKVRAYTAAARCDDERLRVLGRRAIQTYVTLSLKAIARVVFLIVARQLSALRLCNFSSARCSQTQAIIRKQTSPLAPSDNFSILILNAIDIQIARQRKVTTWDLMKDLSSLENDVHASLSLAVASVEREMNRWRDRFKFIANRARARARNDSSRSSCPGA